MTTFWIFSLCIHALVAMDTHPVSPSACSLSVSTNPGETVCQSGEQVNLNAFISGNFSSVEWTPQTGIANPFSPNTTATINGDITYTINVSGPDDLNLIVNGDFSAGVSGFTSDYAWPPTGGSFGPLSPEGQYQVTNNPNSQHANFAACGDATGDGNMMVVNGAGTPNVDVWCQNIGVSPFTDYEFSAWLASVVSGSPAQLQFSINGQLLGFFNASAATCNWQQFSQQWNSTGNSSATICIVNQNTATGGNDFALDGLSFAEVCTASADVTFTISECNATFFPFTDICINSFPFDLNSMLDPGATPGGSWTINGIPSDFFEPGVWGVGLHQVTYEVCDFPCPAIFSDFIVVEPLPDADWAAPPSICESEPVINLNTWLLPGSMSGGIWTINGIQSTTFNPAALGPGQHVITYTVGDPPCDNFLTDVVDVTSLANPSWTPPPPLCEDDAAFSLFDLTNLETTPNGTWLIEGVVNSTFNPALLGAGTYEVTYQAGIVPCDDSETHFITVSPTPNTEWTAPPPVCQSSAPFDLNTLLDPGAATGGTWTINGNTNNIFNPSALTPGNQFIQYFFNTGDCPSVTEGNIVVQFAPEAAFTLSEDTICIGQTTLQTFTGSENGMAVFNYDFDGAMVAGVGVNMRELSWNAPGTYQLSLWLEEGGCISDTVYANVVVLAPLATPIISCGDSTTSSVSFEWTSVAGATGYDVSLISGPPTGILNGNSITFDGLAPGESVSIQVSALSNGPCPPTISEVATCTTLNCIPPDVQITAVDPICLYDNILPFELEVTLNPTGGNGFWQGPGIVDSLLGIFDPMLADTGLHQIHYVYDLNNCLTSEAIFIEINPIPVLQLSGADTICISDSLNIMVLDVLLPGTLLNWDFAGGTSSDSVQSTVQTISWNTPGVKTITAQATLDGCSSDTALLIALVEPLLVAPLIECEASTNSVLFFWNPVANAASYSVTVNSGQSGIMTSDTSFLVAGLMAEEAVSITLAVNSGNACSGLTVDATCTSLLCPPILLEIAQPNPSCFDGTSENIALTFTTDVDTSLGTLSWSGAGIADPQSPIWTTAAGQVGQDNMLILTYVEGVCTYADTVSLQVFATPVASFDLTDVICLQDMASLTFTGQTSGAANFIWDFDGGAATPGTGTGPHTIQWPSPGTYTVSLQLEENGCVATPFSESVQVEPLLVAPLIECEASTSSVLFFWNPVANAASYSVTVNSGQSGVMTSDTSFLVTGLMPGEAVDIQLEISSNNACPAIGINQTCTAALCPVINVEISATDAVCLGELAHVEINIGGEDSGPYDLVLSINSINSFLESLENGYSADLLLSENTTFEILSLSNSQAPGCMIPLPTPVQTLVSTPVTAGNGVLPLSFCSRTDTLVELFDLLLGEDAGGAWTYISGPALGVNALTGSLFSPLSQAPGVYQFSYEITAAAPCPSDEAAVLVEMLERPFADAGADQTLSCLFNEATLGGNGTSTGPNFTYSWQTSSGHFSSATNTALVDVDAAGLYTLLVENTSNGCQDSDEVAVDSDISIPTAAFSITPITCFAANDGAIRIDSIQGGNAPYEILFNGDVFSSALFPMLEPGQYPITIIDAAGCQSAYTFDLSEPDEMQVVLLALFPGEDNEVELGDSLLLEILVNRPEEAIQQVIWQPADLGCDTCLSAVLYPSQSGLLSVEVIDLNGCSDSDQIQYFLRKDRNIYVPNIFSPNGDGANDVFLVFAGKEVRQINRFQVFSRWGEMVHESYNFLPNDPRFGWDGHYRGELMNAAVFVWYAEVELVDGKIVLLKGDVTLLK